MATPVDNLYNRFLQEWQVAQASDPGYMDQLQKNLLLQIQQKTGRKCAAYFANSRNEDSMLNQFDKSYFVTLTDAIKGNDGKLDLIVLSPGGFAEAVEAIVNVIRRKFSDVRVIVPAYAKSAATMLALCGNSIVMKDTAELGPIDPQVKSPSMQGPAQAIVEGFEEIRKEVERNNGKLNAAYIPLLEKLDLALLSQCKDATEYGQSMVRSMLTQYMFKGDANADEKAKRVAAYFGTHSKHLTHSKPLFRDAITKECGLPIVKLEDLGPEVAHLIWEYHYRFEYIFINNSTVAKVFHSEGAYMVYISARVPMMAIPMQAPGGKGGPKPPEAPKAAEPEPSAP